MAIVGPSGAGKSTVLRIVAGLRRPDPGRVAVGGEIWLDSDRGVDLPPEERSCGFMFQEYALFPHLSAWRNVAFGISGHRAPSAAVAPWSCCERFGVGELADGAPGIDLGRRAPAGGAGKVPGPRSRRLLLLDEPLSALDARTRARRRPRAGWRRSTAPAFRRSSSRTTSPKRRCSPTRSA